MSTKLMVPSLSCKATRLGNGLSSFTSTKIFYSPIDVGSNQGLLVNIGSPMPGAIQSMPSMEYSWKGMFLRVNQIGIVLISGREIVSEGFQAETNIKQSSTYQIQREITQFLVDSSGMWNR